jgi:hypothetical protein
MNKWSQIILVLVLSLLIIFFTVNLLWKRYMCSHYKHNINTTILWQSEYGEYNPSIVECPQSNTFYMLTRKSNTCGRSLYSFLKRFCITRPYFNLQKEQVILYQFLGDDNFQEESRFPLANLNQLESESKSKKWLEDARLYYDSQNNRWMALCTGHDPMSGDLSPTLFHLTIPKNAYPTITNIQTLVQNADKNKNQETNAKPIVNKNWTFFQAHLKKEWSPHTSPQTLILADLCPRFIIHTLEDANTGAYRTLINVESPLQKPFYNQILRCTSSPIRWKPSLVYRKEKEYYICAAHLVEWKYSWSKLYCTVFVVFSVEFPFRIIAYTPPTHFFDYSHVEFLSGLHYDSFRKSFLVSMGLNDEYAYILSLPESSLINRLIYV